jgi:hypothetical protein
MIRFAANSYASEVLRMLGSGYALMSVAPQMLAVAALAPFGFCLTLFGQIYRFLPAHLFSGLFRPKLIAEYTKTKSFKALNRQIIMILKISNYTLAAGISIFVVYGATFLDLISGGKYGSEYYLMLGFFALMFVDNHRLVLSDLCSTIEKADLLRHASFVNLLIIPIAALLVLAFDLSYYGLVAAILIGEGLFVLAIVVQLRREGYALNLDAMGQARIVVAAVLSTAVGVLLQASLPEGLFWSFVGAAAIGIAFIAAARLVRPLNGKERDSLERLVGRKVYVV